ncbi:ATP-binding protein [Actinoplanes sp. NPDC026670]|uniref:ATP-binding protein n=1 Tax=Actinoplanes sp. NPDC026670 TaxID=3154700 RepID=UPI003407927E
MNERTLRWWTALGALGGSLLITLAASSALGATFSPMVGVQGPDGYYDSRGLVLPLVPTVATVLALCLLRWWPYLLVAGGLISTAIIWPELLPDSSELPYRYLLTAAFPLLVVGVLGGAQSLLTGRAVALGAAVAGLGTGGVLAGRALARITDETGADPVFWSACLLVAGLAATGPAVWAMRRGDRAAEGPAGAGFWSWRRLRLVIAAGLASFVVLPLALFPTEYLARLLGISWYSLAYGTEKAAIIGVATLALVAVCATLTGLWGLTGALTAATVQVAAAYPLVVAYTALDPAGPARLAGVVAGMAVGIAAVATRWRVAAAGTLAVGAALVMFIADSGTGGAAQRLAAEQSTVPTFVMLVLAVAAVTATYGAAAHVLAPRGAVPAVLGPIAAVLAVAGVPALRVIQLRRGGPPQDTPGTGDSLSTSAVLMLVAAAAIAGLGIAHHLTERWAERKRAEQIRKEAAAAERDRLARPIHDGVLQVLALVQREGGTELAALAGEQEVALRNLLSGAATPDGPRGDTDLRAALTALATPRVEVSAPAGAVLLPAGRAAELLAAVQAALDNVGRHAGPGARAWILLEDETDGVRVTVRDDGAGFEPQRLAEAAAAGRLGVAQSMRGRIADLGGATEIFSRPGQGTEVEFHLPR